MLCSRPEPDQQLVVAEVADPSAAFSSVAAEDGVIGPSAAGTQDQQRRMPHRRVDLEGDVISRVEIGKHDAEQSLGCLDQSCVLLSREIDSDAYPGGSGRAAGTAPPAL